jgi:predicted transcriptional regulator
MGELILQLPDDTFKRLESEAERQQIPVADFARAAIELYLYDEPTKEETLESIRQSLRDGLAGRVHPAEEVIAEIRKEIEAEADKS